MVAFLDDQQLATQGEPGISRFGATIVVILIAYLFDLYIF
jgi:hypothetical protein